MKICVITSCTGEKKYSPSNKLIREDFFQQETLITRSNELKEYAQKACDMYIGAQHINLMEGYNLLKLALKYNSLDLYILSAGYGVIPFDKIIVPYNVSFNDFSDKEIKDWSRFLHVHRDLNKLVNKYDLVFFLLGDKYLKACELPLELTNSSTKLIFFSSSVSKKVLPYYEPYYKIKAGLEEAKDYSYGLIGLKGYLFKLLCKEIKENENLISNFYDNPKSITTCLEKYKKSCKGD